ncbi:MAG: shikimate dehydrogenase [Reichenbachiella sp.]
MKRYGLIGKTLKHSFSKNYFTDKFKKENIEDSIYELYELKVIGEIQDLLEQNKDLSGLNVTIPYKLEVMPFLDELDENAKAINAVNTIKFQPNGKLKGYNTDYYGFRNSIKDWELNGVSALVLGTGGASNAVKKVLGDLSIPFQMVSRSPKEGILTYDDLKRDPQIISKNLLIINTTPVGTFPNEHECPDIPYASVGENHLLFDLVYNPEVTLFLQKGLDVGAKIKNGYNMLVGQAEASWKIWGD